MCACVWLSGWVRANVIIPFTCNFSYICGAASSRDEENLTRLDIIIFVMQSYLSLAQAYDGASLSQ